ncbi:MAG: hypothetical protein J3R72DRAFT_462862 [Linnemannia gamsii]|nr:MAG: hypothetical protein J3R72DRAFT_462862 [Linnemannia gamsii]
MRSIPVRRLLPAQSISVAHKHQHHPSPSIRIRTRSHPLVTSLDNPWQLCFQRAYSRTVLSKDHPRRPLKQSCSNSKQQASSPTDYSNVLFRKHQRPYTSAATAAQPIPRDTHGSLPTTATHHFSSHGSRPGTKSSSAKRESRSTQDLMAQLGQSLKDRNLKLALDVYLVTRRRTLPADQVESWFHFQRQLVQLFHFNQLEMISSVRAERLSGRPDELRSRVLRHISTRVLLGSEHAEALTGLVDAIGKSRAMVQYSYVTNSTTKLQDWREALGVLEEWSAVEKPWEWSKISLDGDVNKKSRTPAAASTLQNGVLERELGSWLVKLMSKLVYSHTYLVRSMLDTIPKQFGIKTTVDMHLVLLNYYAMFGRDGYRDTLSIVASMTNKGVSWKHEPAVYDYLIYSLSHMSGNEAQANKIIEQMLANDLVPREETMKAAILCAARSGDLEACSRYISRMHEEWNLNMSERMKAILLYACAKRGDFDSAVEILGQLSVAGTLVRSRSESRIKKRAGDNPDLATSTSTNAHLEEILSAQDIVNNSNVLLALINQTNNKRGNKKQMTQDFIKEEVAKVLELFTVITRSPLQIDTQLYTIMMQYLSTLPSPLPGMTYLYKEMQGTESAKPNHVTYKIMLEACAEQMDMEYGRQLWDDMEESKVVKDCYIRASYVKGWGKIGYLKQAEWIAREGFLIQEGLDKDHRQHQAAFVLKNRQRREQGLPKLRDPPRPPRRQRLNDIISLNVVHELMRANRAHNKLDRVYDIYQEVEHGKWGSRMRPNQYTLSIVLQACGSGTATTKLVDQGIGLVERYLESQQRQLQKFSGEDNDDDQDETSDEDRGYRAAVDAEETISGKSSLASLSDVNYQLYFTMLGRHHHQRKMVVVWDEMMQVIEHPPSHGATNMVMEALENVQWGATPIKRIQRQLRERWPQVDWDSAGKKKRRVSGYDIGEELVDEDRPVGAGGRFWR